MKLLTARLPILLSWAVLAAYALYLGARYRALPARLASHFNMTGDADGYQSKGAFALSSLLLGAFVATLFTIAPGFLRTAPSATINIPHRAYWLAPERRAATLERLARFSDRVGCAAVATVCALFVLTVRANFEQRRLAVSPWLFVGVMLVFALAQGVALVRSFSRRA